jgi:predicted enzyme related to lactoylglutathione lyase
MGNPVVHFEIRTSDPSAGQAFYRDLFGWAFIEAPPEHVDGYTYIDSQSDRATIHGGLSPPQGGQPMVTVYAEVEDIEASLAKAIELGATIVSEPYEVPGVTIALFADPQGNVVGVAQPRG